MGKSCRKCAPEASPRLLFNFVKGYLRFKTITAQNVSSEAQIKNFFIS